MGPTSPEAWEAVSRSRQGAERSRELYKYFQPEHFRRDEDTREPTSPDQLLTAQAQLVAWRLDARRCSINFIDHTTQYNIAEATKTLHLDNATISDDPKDGLCGACNPVSAKDSICLKTLEAITNDDGDPACFEVLDLSKDARFSWLSFVANKTIIYYFGVPLRTKRGVNIGALCVLDDKPRTPMTKSQKSFMESIAENVMTHLSLIRERAERRRGLNMNRCLNMFINPDTPVQIKDSVKTPLRHSATNVQIPRASHSTHSNTPNITDVPLDIQASPKRNEERYSTSQARTGYHRKNIEEKHVQTFENAARLLHKSLDLDEGGGVVFFDTAPSTNQMSAAQGESETNSEAEGDLRGQGRRPSVISLGNEHLQARFEKSRDRRKRHESKLDTAEILAEAVTYAAITPDPYASGETRKGGFRSMFLQATKDLIKRYPRGKLWNLSRDGQLCSGSDEEGYPEPSFKVQPTAQNQSDASLLLAHFPGAFQLLFLPVWDARSSRWCVCIAYSTSVLRNFTYDTDFIYATAFCNCISIEMARLNVSAADHQKGDFIGSISHELRSPLHGILASCEFLQDTETSSFQQSLVDTVDSCARTLLDTISMVLDYSKINSFEHDWRKAPKKKRMANMRRGSMQLDAAQAAMSEAPPLLNIYGDVDLAIITEEVVEGVTTGQVLREIASLTYGDASNTARQSDTFPDTSPTVPSDYSTSISKLREVTPPVEIILDVAPGEWKFLTQPGAFRRVVMNVFGNALKYTEKGWVKVELKILGPLARKGAMESVSENDGDDSYEVVELTVTDTGRGISPEYLRSSLFTPFSQEDTLAPGTGLGLSLVRSILDMMNGTVEVRSTQNVGTQVTIRIPMMRQTTNGDSSTSESTPSTAGAPTDSISILKGLTRNLRIALFYQRRLHGAEAQNGMEARKMIRSTIAACVKHWYELPDVAEFNSANYSDVVVTDELDLHALLTAIPGGIDAHHRPALVVLCSNASRHGHLRPLANSGRIAFVSKPFGPQKLAKAFLICTQPKKMMASQDQRSLGGSGVQNEVEEVTSSLDKVTLAVAGRAINVVGSHGTLGNDESVNAHLILEEPARQGIPTFSDVSWNATETPSGDFPFPHSAVDTSTQTTRPSASSLMGPDEEGVVTPTGARRPSLLSRRTISGPVSGLDRWEGPEAQPLASSLAAMSAVVQSSPIAATVENQGRPPRLLVVDDNNVNLRLLQTFMKKRKYTSVLSAVDGKQAVDAFESALLNGAPPDIVFMDISMPIMNGFEATRAIRAIEQAEHSKLPAMETPPQALIIALTGLASGRDQTEAFSVGMDLYMTKPVSFKEVGRLLDNWEANGGAGTEDHLPHGSLVGKAGLAPAPKS